MKLCEAFLLVRFGKPIWLFLNPINYAMGKKLTNEQFRLRNEQQHPDLLILSDYVNERTKVQLKCKKCGCEFSAVPGSLFMGHGCPRCGGREKKSQETYIAQMKEIHPDIEVLGEYKGNKIKVALLCKKCGNKWESSPNASLRGTGCPYCSGLMRKTTKQFAEELSKVQPNITVLGEYKNNRTPVKCRCNKCGNIFYGHPKQMLYHGYGCSACSASVGEKMIKEWLDGHDVEYRCQYTFKDCRDEHVLPFDFYIPDKNMIIEFDGKQHYEPNEFFGGKEAFDKLRLHDNIKDKYCTDNNINILRIPYYERDNIKEILDSKLAV